jgi:hypothetical protein
MMPGRQVGDFLETEARRSSISVKDGLGFVEGT